MNRNIVSLFSGCGGLDLGFLKADFHLTWANEYDKDIWATYEANHLDTFLDRRDIRKIKSEEIPDCVGIIGGPPCQSWSEAGSQRGIDDDRGRLFLEYVRILKDKQPRFFLAENVSGMLHEKHSRAIQNIVSAFEEAGYAVSFKLLNAMNHNVPQERKRVIFIGYHVDLKKQFNFDWVDASTPILTLEDAIWDLRDMAIPALATNKTNAETCLLPNHEYMIGAFRAFTCHEIECDRGINLHSLFRQGVDTHRCIPKRTRCYLLRKISLFLMKTHIFLTEGSPSENVQGFRLFLTILFFSTEILVQLIK